MLLDDDDIQFLVSIFYLAVNGALDLTDTQRDLDVSANSLKVTFIFGIGRLHFFQAVRGLSLLPLRLHVIQGYVPSNSVVGKIIFDLVTRVVGNDRAETLYERRLDGVSLDGNTSLPIPEFLFNLLIILGRKLRLPRSYIARAAWWTFGWFAARRLPSNARILHVRSGAGGGGLLEAARNRGLVTLVDHSIAHPKFIADTFQSEEGDLAGMNWVNPSDPFWSAVVNDCARADYLLVNSEFVKTTFVHNGFAANRVYVVTQGVREDFFSLKSVYTVQESLNILFTGHFGLRKGALYLCQALALLKAQGVAFELTVVGENQEGRRFLEEYDLLANSRLVGFVPQEELKSYLALSDIYVFPSLAEGCASSAMEALASGIPCVLSNEAGTPAIHKEHALIVNPKDPGGIAESIQTLSKCERTRRKLGVAGAALISERFTWEKYAIAVHDLYQDLTINE